MVWQRTGTVAVQNGSTTVIGTNVDFAASSRNGDSFVGPDGATYELANVASSTVISILPAYKGPTVSGAAYAIMPVQGYDKMLSDAFNSLVQQFGTKLAALGSTGNYEILPVNKGGTGGSTQADARAGIGLGSASIATVQTSPADATAGRLMAIGAFGRSGIGGVLQASTADANGLTVGGRYTFASGGINLPVAACHIEHNAHSVTGYATQFAEGMTANTIYHRVQVNGVWWAWSLLWGTANTTVDASGFIKKASPIVRICDPSKNGRDDLMDGFSTAGYGVVNDEAAGVTVERIELGRYRILGSLGLSVDGWQVNSPSDRNGGKLLGLASGENQPDGSIIVEFRKARYTLSEEGDLEQVAGPLIEAPLDSWIDVRLQMPSKPPYGPSADAGVEPNP